MMLVAPLIAILVTLLVTDRPLHGKVG